MYYLSGVISGNKAAKPCCAERRLVQWMSTEQWADTVDYGTSRRACRSSSSKSSSSSIVLSLMVTRYWRASQAHCAAADSVSSWFRTLQTREAYRPNFHDSTADNISAFCSTDWLWRHMQPTKAVLVSKCAQTLVLRPRLRYDI